jgi:hypothetical protein
VKISTNPFKDLRRSTRVPLDVSIQVEGEIGVLKGLTVVVNLHGALIRILRPIQLGSWIQVTVYLTGKAAKARVVYIDSANPMTCGIELEKPHNIWGVPITPDDWEESRDFTAKR